MVLRGVQYRTGYRNTGIFFDTGVKMNIAIFRVDCLKTSLSDDVGSATQLVEAAGSSSVPRLNEGSPLHQCGIISD